MSFSDNYLKLRKKKEEEEDIAPVKGKSSYTKEEADSIIKQISKQNIRASTPITQVDSKASKAAQAQMNFAKAQATEKQAKEENKWFKSGAFSDGYQKWDFLKSVGATVGDVGLGVIKGAGRTIEGVADLALYYAASRAKSKGYDGLSNSIKALGQFNVVDEVSKEADLALNENSFLGNKTEGIEEGLGQIAMMILSGGMASTSVGATAITTGLTFASSTGSGMSEAYEGGATDEEARKYGTMVGAGEALIELASGGLGKSVQAIGISRGINGLDDMFAQKLTSKIANQYVKNAAQLGIKATGEGLEEVASGLNSAVAKKLTYMSDEELTQLIEDEQLLDQFVSGAVTSALAQSGAVPGMQKGSLIESYKNKTDFITGLTQNETAVVEKEVEKRVAAEEQDGKKLSKKEKNKIYDQVVEDLDKGGISIDTIEEVLGSQAETYKSYTDLVNKEDSLFKEYEELGKKQGATLAEQSRFLDLHGQVKDIKENSQRGQLKSKLSQEVFGIAKDSRLVNSYIEDANKHKAFEADVTQYKSEAAKQTIQNAINAGREGLIHNGYDAHTFVEGLAAKLSEEKGYVVEFHTSESIAKLKADPNDIYGLNKQDVDPNKVRAFVSEGQKKIIVNMEAGKSLNSLVGHEITDTFRENNGYDALQKFAFEYAEAKGELESRRKSVEDRYAKIVADIDGELTSDIVGDYLFSDEDFVRSLSTKNRNLAQKIYDEVKYLIKLATAGSKEYRQLEKLKHQFEKVWRENGSTNTETGAKYSLNIVHTDGSVKVLPDARSLTNDEAIDYLKQAKRGELRRDTYIPVRKDTPQVIIDTLNEAGETVDNLSLVMQVRKAQQAMSAKNAGERSGNNIRSHALSPKEVVEIVNNLDEPNMVILQTNRQDKNGNSLPNNVAVFVEYSTDSKEGFAVIEFESSINPEFIGTEIGDTSYHTVVTVFEPDVERNGIPYDYAEELLSNPNNIELKIERRQSVGSATGEKHPNTSNELPSEAIIPQNSKKSSGSAKFSLSDSDGKKLTKEQSEYFKDSKVRDDNGNLKVMYHGSQDAGFHIFDSSMSDDDTSFFFVDRNDVAASYSGTTETYEAQTIRTAEDMNNFLAKIGYDNYEAVERDGKYELLENNEHVAYSDTAQGLYEEFCWYEGVGEGDANYKVYLNLKNPLVIDAKGRPWNKIDAEFSQEVYDRYQSLTAEEKAALIDLAEWEDFGMFNSEIQEAKDNELASAYAKMGDDCNIYDLFSVAADSFSEDSMRENSRRYLKTRDFAQRAKEGGYDGVIFRDIVDNGGYSNGDEGASTVAIAFDSEQIKSVANKKPTSDPDIRFSLSESVEETKDLIAIHNLHASELPKALALGGMPMPSIAVIKAQQSHEAYGDVSLIFHKDTIDPKKSKSNKIYGGDAWTPTYPSIEYKASEKARKDIEKKIDNLVPYEVQKGLGRVSLDYDNLSNDLNRHNGDMYQAYRRNLAMQYAFLADTGASVQLPMTEADLDGSGRFDNSVIIDAVRKLGASEIERLANESISGNDALISELRDLANENAKAKYAGNSKLLEILSKKPLYTQENFGFAQADSIIRAAYRYVQNGVEQTIDYKNARDIIEKAVDEDAYKKWVDDLFADIVEKEGIRNNADYFTPSGNRRSWEALHWENTLENVLKVMKSQEQTGSGFFGSTSIYGVANKDYRSIEEVKADSDRLRTIPEEEYDALKDSFSDRLAEIADSIKDTNESNRFIALDRAVEEIVDAVRANKTKSGMLQYMQKWNKRVTEQTVDDIVSLVNDIRKMPTGYFEAKPQRAVGFDEVGVFVIPRNADVKLKQELLNRGYAIAEYDPDVEGDRQKVVNSFEKYKFSLSDVNVSEETPKKYGRWNVSARDLRVIGAPVREDLSGATETVSVDENTAPIQNAVQSEFEGVAETSLEAQFDALEKQVIEAHKAGDTEKARRLALKLNELARQIDAERKQTQTENVTPDGFAPMTESEADSLRSESFRSLEDADAPPEMEAPYYGENERTAITLDRVTAKKITSEVNTVLGLDDADSARMTEVIENYARDKNLTESDLFDEIQRNFEYSEEVESSEDELKLAQNHMKRTKIYVPERLKAEFNGKRKDGFGAFKNEHFGHFYLTTNENAGALKIDVLYGELNELYPDLFPDDILSTADQLLRMGEVASAAQNNTEAYSMPYDDDTVNEAVRIISEGINRYSEGETLRLVNEEASDYLDSVGADFAPVAESAPRIEKEAASSYETAKKSEVKGQQTMFREPEIKAEEPIKTVKDRLQHKLNSAYGELSHNKRLRREAIEEYNNKIANLELKYAQMKNRAGKSGELSGQQSIGGDFAEASETYNPTKAANNLLRSIERYKRLRDEVDADYTKRINDNRARVEKYKALVEEGYSDEEGRMMRSELHAQKVDEIKNAFSENGLDLDETLKDAKDLSTFRTVDNTPQRVMEKSLGYKGGQVLADATVNKVAQNESEGIKWLNSITSRDGEGGLLKQLSKKYHIKPGSKESAAAQMYAEGFYVDENNKTIKYGDAELAKDFPNAETQKNIKGLAKDPRIRQFYDETLAKINESRTRNAYPEIKPLDNYFLHFRAMDDTFSRMGIPFNPNDIKAKDLPTDLNGVTADLKPGQPYFASAMHRRGRKTSYDLLGGMERYATGAKNQIYHIDDIQTLRALRNYIADTYGQANGLDNLDNLSEEEVQDRIKQVYNSHLSTFAKFLNEEANVIAGKTALIDRGLEGIIGRRGMQFFSTINQQVGSNMVGGNVSSASTNFLPVVQAFAKTNKTAFVKGFTQTVANKVGHVFGKADSFADNPTAIRRKGADRFYRTPWQKTADAGYALMSAVDNFSTEVIVRAKYNEFIKKGMSEQQAITEADKWVSRLMGDRSLGQMPQLYNSKMLGLITKFQLEVRNQLDSQFYDTIQETKASNEDIENGLKRNAKTAAKVAVTFAELAVAQHIFGAVFESIAGYNPAFDIIDVIIKACGFDDDEESEDTALDNIEQGFLALLEDMPYTSTFTGGRIPISSALPIKELVTGEDEYGNEVSRLKTLGEVAPYYLLPTGYGQIKKTVQGLSMFSDEHPVAGSYTESGNLRFPVEDTLGNRIQAGIFGQWASENAGYYFDNDIAPLKEKQIEEYVDSDMPIKEYWKYRKNLSKYDSLAEKADYINSLDLTDEQKNLLINNIADRKEPIDMSNYDDFDSFEEFDFAAKNPEKYTFFKENGISYEDYKNADEDGKRAYSWAYENPEGYKVAQAISDDFLTYYKYKGDLYDIRADKDSNGDTIVGSAKDKKAEYINGLDLDYGQKIILFKSLYKADDTYNYDIIEYLNGRDDISYDEMVTILKELGFTVDSQGNVYWD